LLVERGCGLTDVADRLSVGFGECVDPVGLHGLSRLSCG
jgi:hypothetical protein